MKGFPAWPAVISEPQQWGLSCARKKLLVYFYGTKQIAFCSYGDLEAFTEDKKRSLLSKRHGKGADFLKAVNEIIEVYDSLKEKGNNNLDLDGNEVKPCTEKLNNNDNSFMDTESLVNSSNMDSDKKLEGHSVTERIHDIVNSNGPSVTLMAGRSHDLINSDGRSVTVVEDDRCVVNSAPDEPAETVSNIPLSTSSLSNKLRDVQPRNCYTRNRIPSMRRSTSSVSVESRNVQGSSKLLGHGSLDSVDMVPGDNKKDSKFHKNVEDDQANPGSVSKLDNFLLHSSGGIFNQPGTSETSNNNEKLNPGTKVDSFCNSESSENGTSASELKSNGASSLPMNMAVNFKRKRQLNRKSDPHSADPASSNKDDELQVEFSGNLADSPNSKNEVSKSNGDEHLPLVKRARVRMGRPQMEDSPVYGSDVSNNKAGPTNQCDVDSTPIPGNSYSGAQVSNVVNTVSNPSYRFDIPFLSGKDNSSWKNKEYQPKNFALDVEAALPPSKRLHRALEAMSANVAETNNSLPEETRPSDLVLNSSQSFVNRHSNESPAAIASASNGSAILQSAGPSSNTVHSPTCKMHNSESILQNNDVPDSASVPSEANCSDNHASKEGTICEEINIDRNNTDSSVLCNKVGNDISRKSSALCTTLSKPAVDVAQTACIPDRLSSTLEKASGNVVTKLISDKDSKPIGSAASDVERSTESIDKTNNNVTTEAIYRGETAVAESSNNVGDTTSNSSLATKSSSVVSDADTRVLEVHTFSAVALKELNHRNLKDKSTSPDSMPMKELIAVAQARRFSRSTSFPDNFLNAKYIPETSVNTPPKQGSHRQLSPSNQIVRSTSLNDNINSRSPFDVTQQNKSVGNDEANAARRSFKDFLGTLTRTKDSIARATRLAIECAKFGIAGEAIDIIVEHLEKESNLFKRVDLFFLVDSITQCSRNQKGGAGDVYPSLIQTALPRILYAAAPPGNSAWENRRQCLKVLKLWLERKTLSEYIIRHHIREIETINEASFGSSRRPSRTERALNDPLRDNEGMLVDEYGSNAGFQLPNLICTKVLEEEDGSSSSEDRSFEAVTPEHDTPGNDENEESQTHVEKHRRILEEVDGELEMEDVAPLSEVEVGTKCQQEQSGSKSATSDQRSSDAGPPLPVDRPPSPPPLPSSPPPVPPPLPAPVPQSLQMQPKLQVPCDPVGQHPPRAAYQNVQAQQPNSMADHPGNMNASVAPLPPPPFCHPGYAGHPNQMPPPPPMAAPNPPGPHGNFPAPQPYHGNCYHRPPSTSIPNEGYQLHPPPPPPPPPVPPNFPCVPPEHQQRPHHWGSHCSSYPERYQYNSHDRGQHRHDRRHRGHDRPHHFDDRGYPYDDRGYHYDDRAHYFDDRRHHFDDRGRNFDERAIRGPMNHDVTDRGRFPPFPPGHSWRPR